MCFTNYLLVDRSSRLWGESSLWCRVDCSRIDVSVPSEELVGWVVSDYKSSKESIRVVDLCGGSGALAIALSRALPSGEVWAVELSQEASLLLMKIKCTHPVLS